jgi:hypothetical protein
MDNLLQKLDFNIHILINKLHFLIDIDECSKSVDYCHHICLNTIGSYRCSCRAGFYLHLDGKECTGNLLCLHYP